MLNILYIESEKKGETLTHGKRKRDFISKFSELTEENQSDILWLLLSRHLFCTVYISERIDQCENKTEPGQFAA